MVQTEADSAFEMNGRDDNIKSFTDGGVITEEVRDFEDARREYITTLKNLRRKYPQSDLESLEIMAQESLMNNGPKSRAFYRIQATRKMMGSGNIMRKISERAQSDLSEVKAELQRVDVDLDEIDVSTKVFFEPGHYTVMENCGEFELRVVRDGDLSRECTVDFETEDGSAEAGSDYVGKKGTLCFPPGVDEQRFRIEVIDDDVFEQDEHFYVKLTNPSGDVTLATPQVATVMVSVAQTFNPNTKLHQHILTTYNTTITHTNSLTHCIYYNNTTCYALFYRYWMMITVVYLRLVQKIMKFVNRSVCMS